MDRVNEILDRYPQVSGTGRRSQSLPTYPRTDVLEEGTVETNETITQDEHGIQIGMTRSRSMPTPFGTAETEVEYRMAMGPQGVYAQTRTRASIRTMNATVSVTAYNSPIGVRSCGHRPVLAVLGPDSLSADTYEPYSRPYMDNTCTDEYYYPHDGIYDTESSNEQTFDTGSFMTNFGSDRSAKPIITEPPEQHSQSQTFYPTTNTNTSQYSGPQITELPAEDPPITQKQNFLQSEPKFTTHPLNNNAMSNQSDIHRTAYNEAEMFNSLNSFSNLPTNPDHSYSSLPDTISRSFQDRSSPFDPGSDNDKSNRPDNNVFKRQFTMKEFQERESEIKPDAHTNNDSSEESDNTPQYVAPRQVPVARSEELRVKYILAASFRERNNTPLSKSAVPMDHNMLNCDTQPSGNKQYVTIDTKTNIQTNSENKRDDLRGTMGNENIDINTGQSEHLKFKTVMGNNENELVKFPGFADGRSKLNISASTQRQANTRDDIETDYPPSPEAKHNVTETCSDKYVESETKADLGNTEPTSNLKSPAVDEANQSESSQRKPHVSEVISAPTRGISHGRDAENDVAEYGDSPPKFVNKLVDVENIAHPDRLLQVPENPHRTDDFDSHRLPLYTPMQTYLESLGHKPGIHNKTERAIINAQLSDTKSKSDNQSTATYENPKDIQTTGPRARHSYPPDLSEKVTDSGQTSPIDMQTSLNGIPETGNKFQSFETLHHQQSGHKPTREALGRSTPNENCKDISPNDTKHVNVSGDNNPLRNTKVNKNKTLPTQKNIIKQEMKPMTSDPTESNAQSGQNPKTDNERKPFIQIKQKSETNNIQANVPQHETPRPPSPTKNEACIPLPQYGGFHNVDHNKQRDKSAVVSATAQVPEKLNQQDTQNPKPKLTSTIGNDHTRPGVLRSSENKNILSTEKNKPYIPPDPHNAFYTETEPFESLSSVDRSASVQYRVINDKLEMRNSTEGNQQSTQATGYTGPMTSGCSASFRGAGARPKRNKNAMEPQPGFSSTSSSSAGGLPPTRSPPKPSRRATGPAHQGTSSGNDVTFSDMLHIAGLTMREVHPDGNCLFSAVVDQLRIRGDFSRTPRSLRQATIDYLTENPKQEDGTHLFEFLDHEGRTWEQYLNMMRREGQWGDHIVIVGIANLLNKTIVIYHDQKHHKTDRLHTTKVGPNRKKDTKSAQDTVAVDEKDAKDNGDGQQNSVDGFPSDASSFDDSSIFLGHIGETHYVSLRPLKWKEMLLNLLCKASCVKGKDETKPAAHDNKPNSNDDVRVKRKHIRCIFTADEIDFFINFLRRHSFLKYTPRTKYYKYYQTAEQLHIYYFHIHYRTEFKWNSGPQTCSCNHDCQCYKTRMHVRIPLDAQVCDHNHGRPTDLMIERDNVEAGAFKLRPQSPEVWEPLCMQVDGVTYLKHVIPDYHDSDSNTCFYGFICAWPQEAREWITRQRTSRWPCQDAIDEVVNAGCIVFQNHLTDEEKDLGIHWRYTFQLTDNILFSKYIPSSAKSIFFLAAELFDFLILDEHFFCHGVYKNIFFLTLERIGIKTFESQPFKCLREMQYLLMDALKRRHVPDFYIPEYNISHWLPRACPHTITRLLNRLDLLTTHTLEILHMICHSNRLMEENLYANIVDSLVDLAIEKPYVNSVFSYVECLVPLAVQGIEHWVIKEQYGKAMRLIDLWLNEWNRKFMDCNVNRIEILKRVLNALSIEDAWLLAFYLDCIDNKNWLAYTLRDEPSIRLSSILGSIRQNIGTMVLSDIRLPEKFVLQKSTDVIIKTVRLLDRELGLPEIAVEYALGFLKQRGQLLFEEVIMEMNDTDNNYQQTWKLYNLVQVLNQLYTLLYDNENVSRILEVLELFQKACRNRSIPKEMQFLAELWAYFGNDENSEECKELAQVFEQVLKIPKNIV